MFSCEAYIDVFSMEIVARLMCSPMRTGLISSPVEASYPCSLGLMGSTSHLINEKGNEDRDHSSSIDGSIVVSTILPMIGLPPLIGDQYE